ncbi:MAG: capsid assembly protein, partial [Planctomycetota bacterium]
QALATALEGPLAETTLTGLAEAYKVAQPGKLVSTAGDPASGMPPTQKKIVGFANQKEMFAAMDDPRYQYDPEYQEEVRLRCAVNSTQTVRP